MWQSLRLLAAQSLLAATVVLGAAVVWSPAAAQTAFIEVAVPSGLDTPYRLPVAGFGAGVAAADFDDDGDIDLFFPTTAGESHQLYRNLGAGVFEQVAEQVGVGGLDRGRAALWFDADGDRRLDLLVSGDCFEVACEGIETLLRLYRHRQDGTFEDVTAQAGLLDAGHDASEHSGGLAAGDVNGDGYLDFVTGFWMGTLRLFLNQGDGTFLDVSAVAGLDGQVLGYHQPILQDIDLDGRVDIFAAVDFTENLMWLNRDAGFVPFFEEVAGAAGCDNAMNDMGVALGDHDDDGDPDLYVTNIHRDGFHNVLLSQDGAAPLQFAEVSAQAGVRDGGWGWGTTFFDADNDGDLDLAETNGWHTNTWRDPPRLFIHQGDEPPTFVDQASTAGLTDLSWGSSLVAVDIDRDGDLDLVETVAELASSPGGEAIRLHRNQLDAGGPGRHFLLVRPRMAGPNARAIGARVEVHAAGRVMSRWIGAGTSYLGQEPAEAFFGLGAAVAAERVVVHWPGGRVTTLAGVDANQVVTVTDASVFAGGFESGDTTAWSAVVTDGGS